MLAPSLRNQGRYQAIREAGDGYTGRVWPTPSLLHIFLVAAVMLGLGVVKPWLLSSEEAGVQFSKSASQGLKVLVTGAGGQTGVLLMEQLCQQTTYQGVYGMVRSAEKKLALEQRLGRVPCSVEPHIIVGDVTDAASVNAAMEGMDSLVILSSAGVKVGQFSGLKQKLKRIIGYKNPRPSYYYPKGAFPKQVDWLGGKNLIDAAKAAGVQHVVLVSSMAGTYPDHPLNKLGNGNILKWKRKAERYLIASGVDYTIIHPGGLGNIPGGERELVLGVDDELLLTKFSYLPRSDVARVCMDSLTTKSARGRAFDLGSKAPGEGTPYTGDMGQLLLTLEGKDCKYDEKEWP